MTTVRTDGANPAHRSTVQQLIEITRSEGVTALYAGLHANLVGTTISQGVYFYLYAQLRQAFLRRRLGPAAGEAGAAVTVGESLLIASLAGAGNVLVCNPIWVVATRLQAHRKRSMQVHQGATGGAAPAKGPAKPPAAAPPLPGGKGGASAAAGAAVSALEKGASDLDASSSASLSSSPLPTPPHTPLGNGEAPSGSSRSMRIVTSTGGSRAGALERGASTPLSSDAAETPSRSSIIELDDPGHPATALGVAREVWREYGVGGFWNGCGASLVMVINPTLQYALYEWLLATRARVLSRRGLPARPSGAATFALSALAKAGATVLTYPMLTVKTRMMTARRGDHAMAYESIPHAIVSIAKREGVAGFFGGMSTRITSSVLAAALLLTVKEEIAGVSRTLVAKASAPRIA